MKIDHVIYDVAEKVAEVLKALDGRLTASHNFRPEGIAGQVLTSNGADTAPSWQNVADLVADASYVLPNTVVHWNKVQSWTERQQFNAGINAAAVTEHQASLAIAWGQLTSVPTTLGGYGITDAYTATYIATNFSAIGHNHDAAYSALGHTHGAHTLTGTTLAATVVTSSLTSVGTLAGLTVSDIIKRNVNTTYLGLCGDVAGLTSGAAIALYGSASAPFSGDMGFFSAGTGRLNYDYSANQWLFNCATVDFQVTNIIVDDVRERSSGHGIDCDGVILKDGGATFTGVVSGITTLTATTLAGTLSTAAQTNVTSLGTLTALQVDNLNINGNTISSTAGTDLNITPLAGQQIVLDSTIVIDAGVVTGVTSLTVASLSATGAIQVIGTTSAACDVQIVAGTASESKLSFHDSAADRGTIVYNHATDLFQFSAQGNKVIELGANTLGFYGTTPAAQPTGVAVTAGGIHAALVTLGLITA